LACCSVVIVRRRSLLFLNIVSLCVYCLWVSRTSVIITVWNYVIYLRLNTILCCRYWNSFITIWIVVVLLFLVIRFSYSLTCISPSNSRTCTHRLVWHKSIWKTAIRSLIITCLLNILRIINITRNGWTDIFGIWYRLFLII
jgi:hypothetical protein